MTNDIELETDAVDMETLAEYAGKASTCNGWAFWYCENVNENAVVKDAHMEAGAAHCYVYDPDIDATIDATLGQFDGVPLAGAWDGDEHPFACLEEEVYEWTDSEAFAAEYDYYGSPFIV